MNVDPIVLATVAAEWWANFITGEPDAGPVMNNDNSLGNLLSLYLKISNQPKVESSKIEEFKKAIVEHIKNYSDVGFVQLTTDYAPEWPLSEFLRSTGINNTYFPSNTTMTVNFKSGQVSYSKVHEASRIIYPAST